MLVPRLTHLTHLNLIKPWAYEQILVDVEAVEHQRSQSVCRLEILASIFQGPGTIVSSAGVRLMSRVKSPSIRTNDWWNRINRASGRYNANPFLLRTHHRVAFTRIWQNIFTRFERSVIRAKSFVEFDLYFQSWCSKIPITLRGFDVSISKRPIDEDVWQSTCKIE